MIKSKPASMTRVKHKILQTQNADAWSVSGYDSFIVDLAPVVNRKSDTLGHSLNASARGPQVWGTKVVDIQPINNTHAQLRLL